MKVAIIADIHGNAVALQAALSAIEEENPDQIVCLGDVAANGPQPSESLEIVGELDIPVVMGNTDEALLSPEQIDNRDQNPERIKDLLRWAAEQLSDEQIESIRSFAPTIEIQLSDERQLLCYHGTPAHIQKRLERKLPKMNLMNGSSKRMRKYWLVDTRMSNYSAATGTPSYSTQAALDSPVI